MHDVDSTDVKVEIALMAFMKALYPIYSHYLESIQTSGQMKSLDFNSLVEKIAKREIFWKEYSSTY